MDDLDGDGEVSGSKDEIGVSCCAIGMMSLRDEKVTLAGVAGASLRQLEERVSPQWISSD